MEIKLEEGESAVIFNKHGGFKLARNSETGVDPTNVGLLIVAGIASSLRDDLDFAPKMAGEAMKDFEAFSKRSDNVD